MTFEEVYRRYHRPVQREAQRLIGDYHEAEDLAQETFLRVYCRWPSIRNATALPAWIKRIARNTTIDQLRRHTRNRCQSLSPDPEAPPSDLTLPDLESLLPGLVSALDRLPLRLGITWLLQAVDHYDSLEISRITRTSPANVKVRLHRARQCLAREWPRILTRNARSLPSTTWIHTAPRSPRAPRPGAYRP